MSDGGAPVHATSVVDVLANWCCAGAHDDRVVTTRSQARFFAPFEEHIANVDSIAARSSSPGRAGVPMQALRSSRILSGSINFLERREIVSVDAE
jgi:hypothetical protein